MNSNVVFTPLRDLAGLVRTRQISPVELAEVFLERLENLGSKYNAVVTMTRERAEEQARRATEEIAAGNYKGPLHGIPYGLKDAFATSGIPTSYGAAPLKDQTFDYDATVVQNLEKAGAVLVAKLALVELAGIMVYRQPNASFTGPGINPWNLATWSGGSSSGSASAVVRRAGALCHWFGDLGVHYKARQQLRYFRPAPDLRPRQPPRRIGLVLDLGQGGPHVSECR